MTGEPIPLDAQLSAHDLLTAWSVAAAKLQCALQAGDTEAAAHLIDLREQLLTRLQDADLTQTDSHTRVEAASAEEHMQAVARAASEALQARLAAAFQTASAIRSYQAAVDSSGEDNIR